jgi:NAD-dependent SIR2 family protein deacetylase
VNHSAALQDFVERHRRLFVLTGAGISTDPAFRAIATNKAAGNARRR